MENYDKNRLLDAEVAELALGYKWMRFSGDPRSTCDGKIEAFCVSPRDASRILDDKNYMLDDGKYPRLVNSFTPRFSDQVELAFELLATVQKDKHFGVEIVGEPNHLWDCILYEGGVLKARESGETVPLAICKAVKAALGGK